MKKKYTVRKMKKLYLQISVFQFGFILHSKMNLSEGCSIDKITKKQSNFLEKAKSELKVNVSLKHSAGINVPI